VSSTTYSLRPCKLCHQYPRFAFAHSARDGRPLVVLQCACCRGVQAASDALASATWNALNLPDEPPRE
jgi:hypothetical protein